MLLRVRRLEYILIFAKLLFAWTFMHLCTMLRLRACNLVTAKVESRSDAVVTMSVIVHCFNAAAVSLRLLQTIGI